MIRGGGGGVRWGRRLDQKSHLPVALSSTSPSFSSNSKPSVSPSVGVRGEDRE